MKLESPKWHKDLTIYQGMKTAFIIEGNVHDLQAWVYPEENVCEHMPLSAYLNRFLEGEGYDIIVFYNRVDGFFNPYARGGLKRFWEIANARADDAETRTLARASEIMRRVLDVNDEAVAVVFDLANTAIPAPDSLTEAETDCMTRLLLASKKRRQAASKRSSRLLINLMFYIVEKGNDLPAWFYINNPYVKTLTIVKPAPALRAAFARSSLSVFADADTLNGDETKRLISDFSKLTEGFTNVDLDGVLTLCEQRGVTAGRVREAISLFKYGETESHWDKLDRAVIEDADAILSRRVKGQPAAVKKVAGILSRAYAGLSGLQGTASGRPKGVLFFAGPTGTGKTEMAKAITELIFGDESFMTRFDMSEYGQSHADQKLLGAPPGYVGYGAGGQLTNAVKEKPFSVLLFDEIEKADPTILDKFLQILEDGRMTDSSGETVYFSETLIIFTSNLGLIGEDAQTGAHTQTVSSAMPYPEMRATMLASIREYFKFRIRRPELLNRIGDNIVVFDFIREESLDAILTLQLKRIQSSLLEEKGVRLDWTEDYYQTLRGEALANLENGGRGVGNVVESMLLNPLSLTLVRQRIKSGARLSICGIQPDGTLLLGGK